MKSVTITLEITSKKKAGRQKEKRGRREQTKEKETKENGKQREKVKK